jgi:hypothetical protein
MRKVFLASYLIAFIILCIVEIFSIKIKLKDFLITSYQQASNCSRSKFDGGNYVSQYYEDYVLGNLFAGIKDGFYIDVGSNNPNKNNSTKLFYDMGWRGINIEPQKEFYKMLLESRPLDININAALSDKSGVMMLYIPDLSKAEASLEGKTLDISKNINKIQVEVITLNELLAAQNISKINFLKIDVEGHEHKVLQGIDLKKYRPMIIVVEVVSSVDFHNYLTCEPVLLANGYKLGMSDELNRYYYANEYPKFAQEFSKINKCVIMDKLKRDSFCPNEAYCNF